MANAMDEDKESEADSMDNLLSDNEYEGSGDEDLDLASCLHNE